MEGSDARALIERVEGLLEEVESLPDPAARERATEMVAALLDLYGEGLDRIMERAAAGDGGALASTLAEDELVAHLLFLHGLHPVDLEDRVRGALGEVRPYLESHGGDVELLGVEDGVVRLRLEGSCSGCPSSAMTLKLAIEEAIHKAAPDVEAVEAENAAEAGESASNLLQITVSDSLGARNGGAAETPDGDGSWMMAGGLPELPEGGALVKEVAGEQLMFLRLDGTFYSYRPGCPGCGDPLEEPRLDGAEIACPSCGNRYDARRAGRCLDVPALHLEPVPLLMSDDGLVKVAIRSAVA